MSAPRWHGDVAGCNAQEVSEWAGHHSVAVTLTRFGGLFEDGSDAAIGRLDALLGSGVPTPNEVVDLTLARWSSSCSGPLGLMSPGVASKRT